MTFAECQQRYSGGGGASTYRLGPFKIGAFDGQVISASDSSVDGGTFTATYKGETTAALDWNISGDDLEAALEALSTIGEGNLGEIYVNPGESVGNGYTVLFKGAFATELMTVDFTNLTGSGAPYTPIDVGPTTWSNELFTPNVGDTILDFQHALITEFSTDFNATMAYCDNRDLPFESDGSAWNTGIDGTRLIFLNGTTDTLTNFYGTTTDGDVGFQRSAREMQMAYSISVDQNTFVSLPIVCKNAVPIYAAFQGVSATPDQGEVWIWVDIAPATAPIPES